MRKVASEDSTRYERLQALRKFLHNKENNTFCNRTILNWCMVLLFYAVFSGTVFVIFWALLYGVVNRYLYQSDDYWYQKQKIQSCTSPALSFFPEVSKSVESPLIWYGSDDKSKNALSADEYIHKIDAYLMKYLLAENDYVNNPHSNFDTCNGTHKTEDKICLFSKSWLGPCASQGYGYDIHRPCIFLKLSKMLNFNLRPYDKNNLPKTMPESLKRHIRGSNSMNFIWISCGGLTPPDAEIVKSIPYYPQQGFMFHYFPAPLKTKQYLRPLVAIQLDNMLDGFIVSIMCRIYVSSKINRNQEIRFSVYIE